MRILVNATIEINEHDKTLCSTRCPKLEDYYCSLFDEFLFHCHSVFDEEIMRCPRCLNSKEGE